MGIFKRTKDIINANVNQVLDQLEKPEVMIKQMIREMEESISELKASCAVKMADKKSAGRKIADLEESAARWQERAELAVTQGKDDLAKEALGEKKTLEDKIAQLKEDSELLDGIIAEAKENISVMEGKLSEILKKRDSLVMRAERAKEKQNYSRVVEKASGFDVMDKFSRLEDKIDRLEAEADIMGKAEENDFEKMEKDAQVESELEKLKEKMNNKE